MSQGIPMREKNVVNEEDNYGREKTIYGTKAEWRTSMENTVASWRIFWMDCWTTWYVNELLSSLFPRYDVMIDIRWGKEVSTSNLVSNDITGRVVVNNCQRKGKRVPVIVVAVVSRSWQWFRRVSLTYQWQCVVWCGFKRKHRQLA